MPFCRIILFSVDCTPKLGWLKTVVTNLFHPNEFSLDCLAFILIEFTRAHLREHSCIPKWRGVKALARRIIVDEKKPAVL